MSSLIARTTTAIRGFWPARRLDAEGRPWRVRNAPLVLFTRMRLVYSRMGVSRRLPLWVYTLQVLVFLPLFLLGFSLSMWSSVAYTFGWNIAMQWVVAPIVMVPVALTVWVHYRRVKDACTIVERTAKGLCPSCGHDLAQAESPAAGRRRCGECGHVWAWPLPPVPPVRV